MRRSSKLSTPKSVDDSENASDGGEDISGSESGNGDGSLSVPGQASVRAFLLYYFKQHMREEICFLWQWYLLWAF